MTLERRMVDGLPYYYVVRHRPVTERTKSKPSRRQSVAYLGRLTGRELDRWIVKLQRWRSLVDEDGRPLKTKPPARRA